MELTGPRDTTLYYAARVLQENFRPSEISCFNDPKEGYENVTLKCCRFKTLLLFVRNQNHKDRVDNQNGNIFP